MSAASALFVVRSHWGIENRLHWVLDVLMQEDKARNRTGDSAHNFSLLRQMATNLLRYSQTNKHSLKVRRKQAAWSTDYLAELLEPLIPLQQ
ncbi:ISAs1 family transposase [Thiofilum flexile]|uniref:ISAs1 family transposase n=2 Tax=Thiofilum flexile TaxID=125627 RepID=UPI000476B4AB